MAAAKKRTRSKDARKVRRLERRASALIKIALIGSVSELGIRATNSNIRETLFEKYDAPCLGRKKARGVTDVATRLRRLCDEELLEQLVAESVSEENSSKRVYAITKAGRELLKDAYQISSSALGIDNRLTDSISGLGATT